MEKYRFFANFAEVGALLLLLYQHQDMTLNKNKNNKLYYSIKEVAQMIDVAESTLRYWETEFPQLKPRIVAATRVRQYTEKDIEQIRLIHSLIKVRGFKIAAARQYIKEKGSEAERETRVLEKLIGVREELKALKRQLDAME